MQFHPPPMKTTIADVIGNTPMVRLDRIVKAYDLQGTLYAKIEMVNPGFSKKDRIAREMVVEAKEKGDLAEGQPVVELTSGNTGTGLAIVCGALGHPFIAVMSRGNTIERARMMAALGAEVVLVDQAPGSPPNQVSGDDLALVEQRAQQIMKERNAFRADQFNLPGSMLAHERHTGPEIWEQTGGKLDAFVDFAGSGGSFTGTIRFLKTRKPGIRGYFVEPATAPAMAGDPVTNPSHKIQGGGYNMPDLPLVDRSLITAFMKVTNEEATHAARDLAKHEGIFGGFSSGANLASAINLLRDREKGSAIAFLVCDSGLKYLSTDLYPADF